MLLFTGPFYRNTDQKFFNIYNTRRELDRLKLSLNPAQVHERP